VLVSKPSDHDQRMQAMVGIQDQHGVNQQATRDMSALFPQARISERDLLRQKKKMTTDMERVAPLIPIEVCFLRFYRQSDILTLAKKDVDGFCRSSCQLVPWLAEHDPSWKATTQGKIPVVVCLGTGLFVRVLTLAFISSRAMRTKLAEEIK
jgi:hypothetical protein